MEIDIIVQRDGSIVSEKKNIANKKAFIFDVDGTLTESKADIAPGMAALVCSLLAKRKVALLGGGNYDQLCQQCADKLPCLRDAENLPNFLLSPVSGGALYAYSNNAWEAIYDLSFTEKEKRSVMDAFDRAFEDTGYTHPDVVYGDVLEDRGAQITFSALGQKAPVEKKEEWSKTSDVRSQLKKAVQKYIPDFSVRVGGTTSVDVSKVDKAYGVERIGETFRISTEDMLFVGDGLQEGGNDRDVLKTGIDALRVADHAQTEKFLADFVARP